MIRPHGTGYADAIFAAPLKANVQVVCGIRTPVYHSGPAADDDERDTLVRKELDRLYEIH